MNEEMRKSIIRALPKDARLGAIYNDLVKRFKDSLRDEDGPITIRESFRIDAGTKLMYQIGQDGHDRLYVPAKMHQTVL